MIQRWGLDSFNVHEQTILRDLALEYMDASPDEFARPIAHSSSTWRFLFALQLGYLLEDEPIRKRIENFAGNTEALSQRGITEDYALRLVEQNLRLTLEYGFLLPPLCEDDEVAPYCTYNMNDVLPLMGQ